MKFTDNTYTFLDISLVVLHMLKTSVNFYIQNNKNEVNYYRIYK